MSECINDLFLIDSKPVSSRDFNETLIMGGTSIYEVIRVIDGVPIFLEKHLERMKKSADITSLHLWIEDSEIKNQIYELIKLNNTEIGNVKIVFNFRENKNTFFVYFLSHHYPSEVQYKTGVNTILFRGERNNPNAKVINQNFRDQVDKKIKETKAYEAILVDNESFITEGSKSNIFMIKNGKVLTAPIHTVLPGITREIIIEICKDIGVQLEEKSVSENEIPEFDALFITGTSPKVLPISKVDSYNFNSSSNCIVLSIMRAYNKIIEGYIKSQKKTNKFKVL